MSRLAAITRSQFLHGVLSTLIGTVLGFFGAVWWDIRKDESRRREEAARAIAVLGDELETNIAILT